MVSPHLTQHPLFCNFQWQTPIRQNCKDSKGTKTKTNPLHLACLFIFPFLLNFSFWVFFLEKYHTTPEGIKGSFYYFGENCTLLYTRQPLTSTVRVTVLQSNFLTHRLMLDLALYSFFNLSQPCLWSCVSLVLICYRFSLWSKWNTLIFWEVSLWLVVTSYFHIFMD